MAKNLVYDINDKPKFGEMLLFALQQVLAILAATILVPAIIGNGMSQSAALFGAGVGTIIYQLFTKFKSPAFLGSSFAFIGSMFAAFGGATSASAGYAGLVIGTVIFSVSAGLSEVLLSPVVAAIPSEHPDKDMSLLHSLYAWGVFSVVVISTIFLNIFGTANWMYLTLFFAFLPLIASWMFATSPIPEMNISQSSAAKKDRNRTKTLLLKFITEATLIW